MSKLTTEDSNLELYQNAPWTWKFKNFQTLIFEEITPQSSPLQFEFSKDEFLTTPFKETFQAKIEKALSNETPTCQALFNSYIKAPKVDAL